MTELYNLNIERAILSALLFEPYGNDCQTIISELQPENFYLPFHQHFMRICQTLVREEKPVDETFILSALGKEKVHDEVAMLEIMSTNAVGSVKAYCDEIIEFSQRRSLSSVASMIKKNIIEDGESAEKVISATLKHVESIAEGGTVRIGRKSMAYAEEKEPEFLCKTWLPFPKATTSMVVAPGGTGKSWLSLQLSIRIVREDPSKRVFLWMSEDPEGIVKSRFNAIVKDILIGKEGTEAAQIDICTEDPVLLLETHGRTATLSSQFYTMKRELREYDVIIIDPLLAFYGGDENDNSQARVFMQPFLNWARSENKVIIFLHHSKKGEAGTMSKARGAGAIIDAVRCVYDMDKIYIKQGGDSKIDPHSAHMRSFTLTKDNYGAVRHLDGFKVEREIVPKKSAPHMEVEYEEAMTADMPYME